jgi:cysteine desulfurase
MRVYLDNAATTPLESEVIDAMTDALRFDFGNPSSIHAEGRRARASIENARKIVARHLGASVGEIYFTSCGTESNNMAIKCAVRDLGVRRIISSHIEHHCVLHSLQSIREHGGVEVDFVELDALSRVNFDHLENLLRAGADRKTMVSLMHANNEIGTLLDLERTSQLCRAHGVLFHTDTVQTVGYYPFDLSKLKLAFMSGSAHKFHGPKGVGFIYISNDNLIHPLLDGGSQERNMRAGTENIAGIVGLAKALDLAYQNLDSRRQKMQDLRDYFAKALMTEIPGIRFLGAPLPDGHYKVLSVSFPPKLKYDLLVMNLDIAGISASGGSACSSGAEVGSHVLLGIRADPDRPTVRFSFSHRNTPAELDLVINVLKTL